MVVFHCSAPGEAAILAQSDGCSISVLCCTLQDKLKVTWDTSGWEEVYPTDIPQQQNGFDCGVFALMFCNRMGLKGGAFDFRQQDISVNVRVAITCDLLDGAIKATARKT